MQTHIGTKQSENAQKNNDKKQQVQLHETAM